MRLSSCISIADASGKLVVGEPGDYLIEGSDGTRRIARRDIFEDIYVELETPVALAHAG